MRVDLRCPYCAEGKIERFFVHMRMKNDSVHQFECPNGHEFEATILLHEFQKLFEVAVSAIVDEYYREAIGSFTASYERFMELFIRILMRHREIDEAAIDRVWKTVSRQSERQLGAFIFLYQLQFGERPAILNQNLVNLRNRVIHQGYFPSRSECVTYGTAVLEFIRGVIRLTFEDEALKDHLIGSINYQADFGPLVTIMPYPMIGTNRPPGMDKRGIEEMIQSVVKGRTIGREE